jgi:hypothetical protein
MALNLDLNSEEKTFLTNDGNANAKKLKSAFETVFDGLDFKKSNYAADAALYYLSLIACYRQPSLPEIKKHIKFFYDKKVETNDLVKARNELVERGILAKILFTANDNVEFTYDLADYFPNDPSIIWDTIISEMSDEKRSDYQNNLKIVNEFSKIFYKKRFSLESNLLKNNQLVLAFNKMWPFYFLLTYSLPQEGTQKKNNLSFLLSGLRKDDIGPEVRPSKHYIKLLINNNIKALLDNGNDDDQKKIEKYLRERYPVERLDIRFTKNQLYGSTRRIILENIFSMDGFKVHPSESNTNNFSYVGIIYFNKNKNIISKSFDSWWRQNDPNVK